MVCSLMLAFLVQVHARELAAHFSNAQDSKDKLIESLVDELVDTLVDWGLKASPCHHTDLDDTTLQKVNSQSHLPTIRMTCGKTHPYRLSGLSFPVLGFPLRHRHFSFSFSRQQHTQKYLPISRASAQFTGDVITAVEVLAVVALVGLQLTIETEIKPRRPLPKLPEPLGSFINIQSGSRSRSLPTYPRNLLEEVKLPEGREILEQYEFILGRKDEKETLFDIYYSPPRSVQLDILDKGTIALITAYYRTLFSELPSDCCHLDLACSWFSFLPKDHLEKCKTVVGIGTNPVEMQQNKQLTQFYALDISNNPKLPLESSSFDVVTNALSVDYLNNPAAILEELLRILKPGGIAVFSFSVRPFSTQVSRAWTRISEWQQILIAAAYFSSNGFQQVQAYCLDAAPTSRDPVYIVQARKPESDE